MIGLEAVELPAVGADDEVGVVPVHLPQHGVHRPAGGEDDDHARIGDGLQRRGRPRAELVRESSRVPSRSKTATRGMGAVGCGHCVLVARGHRGRSPPLRCRAVWAKRVGAIVLAAVLIAGGLLLRRALDDGDDSGGSGGDGTTTVVCIPELESTCRGCAADEDVQLSIEDAGVTYDAWPPIPPAHPTRG